MEGRGALWLGQEVGAVDVRVLRLEADDAGVDQGLDEVVTSVNVSGLAGNGWCDCQADGRDVVLKDNSWMGLRESDGLQEEAEAKNQLADCG